MSSRVKIEFEGREVEADELEFTSEKEDWSSYTAEDGAVIKLKHVTAKIYRLVGRTKEDGSPMYVVSGTALLTTTAPHVEAHEKSRCTESEEAREG